MSRFFAIAVALAALSATSLAFAGSKGESNPAIAASVVQTGETAQTVRLVVTPPTQEVESKVVCGVDSIRVRFEGLRVQDEEIKDLQVPSDGPMRRVRVVPRLGGNSVVQIFARGRQLAACSRTTVMVVENDVVISMAMTDAEKARRAKILGKKAAKEEKAEPAAAMVAKASEVEPDDEGSKGEGDLAEILARAKASAKDDGEHEEAEADGESDGNPLGLAEVTGGDDESDGLRYLAGIGFALIVAGFAWYLKRRKGGVRGGVDSIDILSQKRLSAHQSLIVAQVQGTKFLLAVGDKTVTNLGMIPEEGISGGTVPMIRDFTPPAQPQVPVQPAPTMQAPQPQAPPMNQRMSTRSFGEMISEELRSRPAPAPAVQETIPQAPPARNFEPTNHDSVPSNVAGLISMARMRATLSRGQAQAPTAEA